MVENGFKVAKSSTTIDCIIKKRLKREAFLNQSITNEYRNYDIEFLRVEQKQKRLQKEPFNYRKISQAVFVKIIVITVS